MADLHLNLEVKLEEFYKKKKNISVRFQEVDSSTIRVEKDFIVGLYKASSGRITKALAMEGDTAVSFAASWTNMPDTVVDEYNHSKELTEQLRKNLEDFFRLSVTLIDENTTDEFVELYQIPGKIPVQLFPALEELSEEKKIAFYATVRTYREGFYLLIDGFERELSVSDLSDFTEEFSAFGDEGDENVGEKNVSVDQIQFFTGWTLISVLLVGLFWGAWSLFSKNIFQEIGVKPVPQAAQSIEIEEKLILPGVFVLGCQREDGVFCEADEDAHEVSLTYPISVMQTEVSQELYLDIMEENPSLDRKCGLDCPVENVTWFDAVTFANRLSKNHEIEPCYQISDDKVTWDKGITCFGWRLPTEAEWEIAARGRESHRFAGDADPSVVAWMLGETGDEEFVSNKYAHILSQPHPSCTKELNSYGLCDMSGNVWEWVWDWYDHDFYQKQSATSDPLGGKGNKKVIRGGAWDTEPKHAYVYTRMAIQPWSRNEIVSLPGTTKENVEIGKGTVGFRLVRRLAFQNRNTE